MIQDEAFRCKEITERLLDFSRLGDVEHQETDLRGTGPRRASTWSVTWASTARNRSNSRCDETVLAWVNAQEMKQVVLEPDHQRAGKPRPGRDGPGQAAAPK